MTRYEKTGRIDLSAAHAGVDRKTAAKYLHGAPGPQEPREPRHWRTHADAFASVWEKVEERLRLEPRLQAKTLWEELRREHPGEFRAGQRRSFERRVRQWRVRHGSEPELYFTQEHIAGERLQLDWVDCNHLRVVVAGRPLMHKLVHVTLPYSNWEWARVCRSESLLSLKVGLQSALWELGGVPAICQTDHSSAATHQVRRDSGRRDYNERYLGILHHLGMKPGVIGVGEPHQNGDVESSHHHLAVALEQELLLRGHREFEREEQYEAFVHEVVRRRNEARQVLLEKERGCLRALPSWRLPEYEEMQVRVNRESLARVGKQTYSVPARWAGTALRVRLYESRLEFFHGNLAVAQVERHPGDRGVFVNWRHVLPQLRRKPGAFARWRHRQHMFPSRLWREFYDALCARHSNGRAEREYLGVLTLALEKTLPAVEEALGSLGPTRADLDAMRLQLHAQNQAPEIDFCPDLQAYDRLLEAVGEEVAHA